MNKTPDLPQVLIRDLPPEQRPARDPKQQRRWRWIVAGFLALGLFGLFFPVEKVIVAPGRIIPSDRVKAVQHLEGGIVTAVSVQEGQRVQQGQPLVTIDLGGNSLNLEELSARYDGLRAMRVRHTAETEGRTLRSEDFPAGLDATIVQAQMGAYRARALEQQGIEAGAVSALEQSRSQLLEQQAKISGLEQRAALSQKELDISEQLGKEQLIGQLEVLEKRRQLESVRSDLAVARQGLQSSRAAVAQAQAKVAESRGAFQRKASEDLADVERQLASLNEDLTRARSQRERTVVVAPAAGLVKGLRSNSPGWVVKPGEQIMEIVPDEDSLLVEARLNPDDRGYVGVGQKAKIKVTAYDFLRYGMVDGAVTLVAADADRDESKADALPYYRLLVSTKTDYVGRPDNRITPGMETETDLVVGHEPFIWYMLRPVLRVKNEAFREP
ncbi:MAG: HlyD family type I secretion periplasmic adaptor subunit [Comamonas sp.]